MNKMHPKKKVEIVVDASACDRMVRIIENAGAKGHTVIPQVTGKGHRGIRSGHDIFEDTRNVVILAIVPEPIAMRILEEALRVLETTAGVAYVSDVQVARDDYF